MTSIDFNNGLHIPIISGTWTGLTAVCTTVELTLKRSTHGQIYPQTSRLTDWQTKFVAAYTRSDQLHEIAAPPCSGVWPSNCCFVFVCLLFAVLCALLKVMFLSQKQRLGVALVVLETTGQRKTERKLWAEKWLLQWRKFTRALLLKELEADVFRNYLRMDEDCFTELLELVKLFLAKTDTLRAAVSCEELWRPPLPMQLTDGFSKAMKIVPLVYSHACVSCTLGQQGISAT